jgi:SAM-dependent methyltransferase
MEAAEYVRMHQMELVHAWFLGRRELLLRAARAYAPRASGALRVLDLGCGTGANTLAYRQLGTVVGIEPNPEALAFALKAGCSALCRGGGTELPVRDACMDIVLASDVLEHIDDDAAVAREIRRALRPGGVFVCTVPAHPWLFGPHDRALHHHRRYTRRSLRGVLERAGLKVEWLTSWNSTLFPAVCLQRWWQRVSGDGDGIGSSAMELPGPVGNAALTRLLGAEGRLALTTGLPWGLTYLAVALRPS